MKHRNVLNISLFIISFFLFSCKAQLAPKTEFVLGTICTINLFSEGKTEAYELLFSRLHELEKILSTTIESSNVNEINKNAGIAPVFAQKETFLLVDEALRYASVTQGAFNPAIGNLVTLWNIGSDSPQVPQQSSIETALQSIDYSKIFLNTTDFTIFLSEKNMRLDLGAIAKGYAADELVRILIDQGISKAIIDLGGNIYAHGEKGPNTPWVIGIRDPETNRGDPLLAMPITNKSIVTSGIYERYFEQDGKKYHHILDPKTGYPSENELLSVSIIASSSMVADALSTSIFLLGTKKGLEVIENTKDTEAICIKKDYSIHISSGLEGIITLYDDRYTLMERITQ